MIQRNGTKLWLDLMVFSLFQPEQFYDSVIPTFHVFIVQEMLTEGLLAKLLFTQVRMLLSFIITREHC